MKSFRAEPVAGAQQSPSEQLHSHAPASLTWPEREIGWATT